MGSIPIGGATKQNISFCFFIFQKKIVRTHVFINKATDFLHPFTDRRRQTACAVICYRFHFSVNCPTNFLTVFPRFFIENAQFQSLKAF